MPKKRILSLLPSATEIVWALGATDQLVGRSHECDYPPEVSQLPVCTSSKVDSDASSREIDRQVKERLREAMSIYRVESEKLNALKPDIILTQVQCEVCAVSLKEVEEATTQWLDKPPQIISLSPKRLADIWADIGRVAEALEVADHGKEVIRSLKNRVVDIIEKTCELKDRPSIACIEWIDPLMAAGNWVPELVELAGGHNVAGEAGKHSPWMDWETLAQMNPQIMVIMPCGFNVQRTRAEMPALIGRPDWAKLRAVKNRRVYLTDGNQYFNRPGPRIVESLEILTEIIQGDRFNFGHPGKAWERL